MRSPNPNASPDERAVEQPVVSRFEHLEHLEELGELLGLFLGVDDLGTEWPAAEQPERLLPEARGVVCPEAVGAPELLEDEVPCPTGR
jgi:hypothetical protein